MAITMNMGVKSDGNGCYLISKGTFAFITIAIMLLSSIVSVVATSTTMQVDISHLKDDTAKINANSDNINKIETEIATYSTYTQITMTDIRDMKEDIRVIRRDLQELLKK